MRDIYVLLTGETGNISKDKNNDLKERENFSAVYGLCYTTHCDTCIRSF